MIQLIADHIITPLGEGTENNLNAVLRGESCLRLHNEVHGEPVPEPFVGSLFEHLPQRQGFTPFESLCIAVAEPAIKQAAIDVSAADCIFILSTTKGNIWTSPADSARKIATFFGNNSTPVVVSTACTSGVTAQLTAYRLLSRSKYKTAVIIGCDVQTLFVVSGFQSFKALSPNPCKPFDAERDGLNAGEAAAAMILQQTDSPFSASAEHSFSASAVHPWTLLGGSVHNDANHISGPSRTAEGSMRCLNDACELLLPDNLACISVHGTGTLYNDEMEALAIHRAGLEDVPVSGLKGIYGHAMGAAGLMETILTIHALNRGIILPTIGFSKQGTTYAVNLSAKPRTTEKHAFIKLLSGFGGVNAAVAWSRETVSEQSATTTLDNSCSIRIVNEIHISQQNDINNLYRSLNVNYPKFFKMDSLCRLGFVATELLLKECGDEIDAENTALILANHSASIQNDTAYQATIADPQSFFPSPALFVYTLPNIVAGELAIRHHLFGETSFYILEKETDLQPIIDATICSPNINSAIVGWLECTDKTHYEAHLKFVSKTND